MQTRQTPEIKLRPVVWTNTATARDIFGFEMLTHGAWIPMGDEEGFFLFDTKEKRDAAMEKHRAALDA